MKPDFPVSATLLAFLVASLVLAVTPGPGVLYVVTRTIAQGRRAGLTSVAGVALGNLCNAMGASIGLAALLAASSLAFFIVKATGAAYLLYLGFKALRPSAMPTPQAGFRSAEIGRAFREGFLVALLNPKTALFFAAFLPQFVDPASSAVLQSVSLGSAFVLIAAATDTVYVLAAAVAAPAIIEGHRGASFGRYASAAVYFGLGLLAAVSSADPTK
jgi:threonine/homoserine/homoserine lactone efflux protein